MNRQGLMHIPVMDSNLLAGTGRLTGWVVGLEVCWGGRWRGEDYTLMTHGVQTCCCWSVCMCVSHPPSHTMSYHTSNPPVVYARAHYSYTYSGYDKRSQAGIQWIFHPRPGSYLHTCPGNGVVHLPPLGIYMVLGARWTVFVGSSFVPMSCYVQ